MIEFSDLGDLRPAPRNTPSAVLWAMLTVAVGGLGALVWTQSGPAAESALAMAPAAAAPSPAAQSSSGAIRPIERARAAGR